MIPIRALFNFPSRRRVVALLFGLCIVAAQAEFILPDVHDADGSVAQLAAAGTEQQAPDGSPAPRPSHAAHVDHCTHAHVFADDDCPAEIASLLTAMSTPDTPGDRLSSFSTSPHLRPPIA